MGTDRTSTLRRVRLRFRGSDVLEVDDVGRETPSKFSMMFGNDKVSHRARSLRVLAFSDYHEQNIPDLIKFAADRKTDLILYGGDAVDRFQAEGRNLFEELATHVRYGVCAVAGNDDRDGRTNIVGEKVYAVHRRALILGGFVVVGLEGAPCFPPGSGEKMNLGPLVYPDRLTQRQIRYWEEFRYKALIVVSHAPPFGVLDKAKRHASEERSIGSKPLHEFLMSSPNAVLCLCGHVHLCASGAL